MKNWLYESTEIDTIEKLPEGTVGFVYRITHTATGKFYIGKKILHSTRNKTLTKRETEEWNKPGKIPKKRKVVTESDWSKYWGSSKTLLAAIKESGHDAFTREILKPCISKKQMTYWEVYYQMRYEVLHIDSFNDNILAKLFRKDV